jgi:hypothetical protein
MRLSYKHLVILLSRVKDTLHLYKLQPCWDHFDFMFQVHDMHSFKHNNFTKLSYWYFTRTHGAIKDKVLFENIKCLFEL